MLKSFCYSVLCLMLFYSCSNQEPSVPRVSNEKRALEQVIYRFLNNQHDSLSFKKIESNSLVRSIQFRSSQLKIKFKNGPESTKMLMNFKELVEKDHHKFESNTEMISHWRWLNKKTIYQVVLFQGGNQNSLELNVLDQM